MSTGNRLYRIAAQRDNGKSRRHSALALDMYEERRKLVDLLSYGNHNNVNQDNVKNNKIIKLPRRTDIETAVYSWFEVTLQKIDVPNQTFDASIEIHLFWKDKNLPNEFPNYQTEDFIIHNDYVPIKMNEIFENKTQSIITVQPQFRYFEKGIIYMFFVVECRFAERMELHRFPLDRQFLNIQFNALRHPLTNDQGDWCWILKYPKWMPSALDSTFKHKTYAVRMLSSITEYQLLDPWINYATNENQPYLIRLRVNRKPAYYFGNIILPNFLIVSGCFSAFVVPKEKNVDRFSITIALLLAAVAFRFVVASILPKVSYLTLMDYYLIVTFVALTILLFEQAIISMPSVINYVHADIIEYCILFIWASIWFGVHIISFIALINDNFLRITWTKMDRIDSEIDDEAQWEWALPENCVSQYIDSTDDKIANVTPKTIKFEKHLENNSQSKTVQVEA